MVDQRLNNSIFKQTRFSTYSVSHLRYLCILFIIVIFMNLFLILNKSDDGWKRLHFRQNSNKYAICWVFKGFLIILYSCDNNKWNYNNIFLSIIITTGRITGKRIGWWSINWICICKYNAYNDSKTILPTTYISVNAPHIEYQSI